MDRPSRNLALDLLRAAAVLLVIGRHLPPPGLGDRSGPERLLEWWQRGGWVGVDLFFVLSGYLVAGLLFQEYRRQGNLCLWRFLVRRGLKIYPAFYAFLLLTIPLTSVLGGLHPVSPRALASEVFFLQSYVPAVWNHTWSLAVEEHFYLLLPLVLAVVRARSRAETDPWRAMVPITLVVVAAALGLRLANAWARPYHHGTHLFPTHLRLDTLLVGVLLAYGVHFHGARVRVLLTRWRRWLLVLGVVLLAPAFLFALEQTPLLTTVGLTGLALGSAALLGGLLFTPIRSTQFTRGLGQVGAHSYSIYLWHMPVVLWGVPLVERQLGAPLSPLGRAAFAVAASLGMGILMARLIEVPVLRLRDRWVPSRSTQTGAADAIGATPVAVSPS